MGYQTAPHASLGLLCGLYQFVSHTEGTVLLFESERLGKSTISAHQLKSTLKVTSMHYPETPSTRQKIVRSAFTDGFY